MATWHLFGKFKLVDIADLFVPRLLVMRNPVHALTFILDSFHCKLPGIVSRAAWNGCDISSIQVKVLRLKNIKHLWLFLLLTLFPSFDVRIFCRHQFVIPVLEVSVMDNEVMLSFTRDLEPSDPFCRVSDWVVDSSLHLPRAAMNVLIGIHMPPVCLPILVGIVNPLPTVVFVDNEGPVFVLKVNFLEKLFYLIVRRRRKLPHVHGFLTSHLTK